jgi:hypothetical protein
MAKDGEYTRNYGKKSSLNMKNYSSLAIGNNDGLREIYDRKASQDSFKSCQTPRI